MPTPIDILAEKTQAIRISIITMLAKAQSGHPGGALGMSEVFVSLYFDFLNHDPQRPDWSERDRILLSNGHICPGLYATLAEAGYFPKDELLTLRRFQSRLQGHPHRGSLPGIENTGGPLGQGISQACGVALGFKMDQLSNRVHCLCSDGEHNEGQLWEAYLLAAKYKLNNLTVWIDRNNIQIDGPTDQIMPLEPLTDKIKAFGWNVLDIDGHAFHEIRQAYQTSLQTQDRPTAVICHTIPGKGVDFMEGKYEWHGKAPSMAEAQDALTQLGGDSTYGI